MESLDAKQTEAIKKMSTARLVSKLLGIGMSEDEVCDLDREGLMKTWAKAIVEGKDKPGATGGLKTETKPIIGYDVELEKRRFDFEIKRWELEEERRKKDKEAEEKRRIEEREIEEQRRKEDKESEAKRMELEQKRLQLEHDKLSVEREAEMRVRQKEKDERDRLNSPVHKAKLYGDALRGTISRMPNDAIDLVPYFRTVEQLFVDFKVEDDLKAHLLKPHLSEKARALVSRMSPDKSSKYDEIKKLLLHEFQLNSAALLQKYNSLKRDNEETYTLYGNRLKSILLYYVESRKTSTFDDLIDLLVCDKIKSQLPDSVLKYITNMENSNEKGWLQLSKLLDALDIYNSTYEYDKERPRRTDFAHSNSNFSGPKNFNSKPPYNSQSHANTNNNNNHYRPSYDNNRPTERKKCFTCGSTQHLANFHKKNPSFDVKACFTGNDVSRNSENRPTCTTLISSDERVALDDSTIRCELRELASVPVNPVVNDCMHEPVVINNSNRPNTSIIESTVNRLAINEIDCEIRECLPIAKSTENDFSTLQYIDVCMSDFSNECKSSALVDTGAEISLVHSEIVKDLNVEKIGTVRLRGIIGDHVEADLVRVGIKLADGNVNSEYIPIVIAVSPLLNDTVILNTEVVNKLLQSSQFHAICKANADDIDDVRDSQDSDDVANDNDGDNFANTTSDGNANSRDKVNDTVDDSSSETCSRSANADLLRQEQASDDTLATCRKLASQRKGGYFYKNDLLYRNDEILGEKYEQLILPVSRRAEVMKLAHDTYGAHMGIDNTKHRIRLSFYWPTLAKDIHDYVQTCSVCARRRRITCYDNTPITPIPRNEKSFNHWYIDAMGPIHGSMKADMNYCLLCVDSNTRFPMAFALRALTAKNIVDCLIKLWSLFGVSQFITLDNATCHSAKLTRLLMERMGCSPIFITPTNSRGNGIAERYIGVVKEMIHKVACDKQKSWFKYLDLIMWCLREVPQSSTGLPPWLLAFGHLPRGPCAILKEFWTDNDELPLDLAPSVTEYLQELRNRIAEANNYATSNMNEAQRKRAKRYNLRARPKSFEVGDSVLILVPDSTSSRLWAKWRAPATIIEKKSPYSYLVEYQGTRHYLPVSKLRPFNVRCDDVKCDLFCTFTVNSVTSIVYDDDEAFGCIEYVDVPLNSNIELPSKRIPESKLSHLSEVQRLQLCILLDEFADLFNDKPGLCDSYEHEINVNPDFRPKRLKEYRIPEKLRGEVRRQITELLSLGMIRRSNSPMASPLICVLKGPNGRDGVRVVMDYRYLNRYTVSDALSPPDISTVLQRIGRAKFISTYDGKSSYWTIPIKREHQWLTGFVCEGQTYEWTRAAFGLRNSGCSFLRMIERVLQPVRDFVESFVDDMAVCSETTWEDHLRETREFFLLIRKSGLTLTLKKSNFGKPEVKFCGHIVGSGQRRIDSGKFECIQGLKRPESKKQVRSVLGTFSWFRDYIPNFTENVRPLIELTQKRIPERIPWGEEQEKSFSLLKQSLCDATNKCLGIIDWSKPFNIYTDASDYSISGSLTQCDADGRDYPICFYSKKLTDSQKNWPIIEREAVAVLEALQRFKSWIFGYEINIFCDHNPLSYLTDSTPKSPRLLRWALALQSYNLSFHYKSGTSPAMAVPDCLSRLGP